MAVSEGRNAAPDLEGLSRDERRRVRALARAADRAIPPARDAAFGHFGLEHLRSYRQALITEEDTVSYWRRLLQARLDVVRAGDRLAAIDPAQLRSILSNERFSGRQVHVSVGPAAAEPSYSELPDLARLWSCCPSTEAERAEHEAELVAAEIDLSEYRAGLHRRLDAATAELIARYHEEPTACLVALPLPRAER